MPCRIFFCFQSGLYINISIFWNFNPNCNISSSNIDDLSKISNRISMGHADHVHSFKHVINSCCIFMGNKSSKEVGSNPIKCWDFFFSFYPPLVLFQAPRGGATLLIFPLQKNGYFAEQLWARTSIIYELIWVKNMSTIF